MYILILGSLLGDAGPPPCCSYFCSPPSPAGPSPTSPSLSIGKLFLLVTPLLLDSPCLWGKSSQFLAHSGSQPAPTLPGCFIGSSSSHQWEFVASSQSCGHYPCRRHRASGTPTSVQLYSSCARQTKHWCWLVAKLDWEVFAVLLVAIECPHNRRSGACYLLLAAARRKLVSAHPAHAFLLRDNNGGHGGATCTDLIKQRPPAPSCSPSRIN